MSALRADVNRLMRDMGRMTRHGVGDTVSSGTRFMNENLGQAAERSRHYVRDNPLAACAAAAVAGFTLALWLRR